MDDVSHAALMLSSGVFQVKGNGLGKVFEMYLFIAMILNLYTRSCLTI